MVFAGAIVVILSIAVFGVATHFPGVGTDTALCPAVRQTIVKDLSEASERSFTIDLFRGPVCSVRLDCIGVKSLHLRVAVVFVHILLSQAEPATWPAARGIVPGQGQTKLYSHIADHKHDQRRPRGDLCRPPWVFFNPCRDAGIHHPEPHHGGKAPEKAVKGD